MGLAALILNNSLTTVSDDNGAWRQFVLDHLDYLAARAVVFTLTPEMINRYRYDLRRYLKNELKRHEDLAWIVMLLNDLPNDFAFDKPGTLLVPTDRKVTELYHSYKTTTANAR